MLRFGLLERIISFSFSVYACECGVMGYFVGPHLLSPFLLESVRLLNRDCIVPCGIEHFFFTASARYFCFFYFGGGTIVCLHALFDLGLMCVFPTPVELGRCMYGVHAAHMFLFFILVLPGGVKVPIFALQLLTACVKHETYSCGRTLYA